MNINNEISPLKKVIVHRPGEELLNLTPDNMHELLFDDIPYLNMARYEHDEFIKVLKENRIEPVYLEDLMVEVLDKDENIRNKFIREYVSEAGINTPKYKDSIIKYLSEFNNKDLVSKTIEGISLGELSAMEINLHHSLTDLVTKEDTILIKPMPNLLFTRDNITVIGNGISLNKMTHNVRQRENIYYEYIFNYHDEYKDINKYYIRHNKHNIEGGDIIVLNEHIVVVGISTRTTPEAIEELSLNIFNDNNTKIDTILAIDIPDSNYNYQLDTIFTQIDYDKFLYYPGIVKNLKVFEIKKDVMEGIILKEVKDTLENILETYLKKEIILIPCGGGSSITSLREWWNDGINVLCISPGVVISYNRNNITNAILRKYGIRVIEIPCGELSRGRGGPRCMVAELIRIDN